VSNESRFIKADEVAKVMDVSSTTAYKIIKELNTDLKKQGYITVAGKVSRKYFNEKVYL
jgi:Mn-dependent DtxR family transcriptional regulator